jgi:hypothetical protein
MAGSGVAPGLFAETTLLVDLARRWAVAKW